MSTDNPAFHWGKPNPDFVPTRATSSTRCTGSIVEARSDLIYQSQDNVDQMYDHAPDEAPVVPSETDNLPHAAQVYVRQAVSAAVLYNDAEEPYDLMPGSDDRVVCMTQDKEILGYGSVDDEGLLHSKDDEPSLVRSGGSMEWHRHGVLHRIGGPAFIYPDPDSGEMVKEYFHHGVSIDERYADQEVALDPDDISARAVLSNERDRRNRAGLNR